jgi:hypothetical protein
MLSNVIPWVSEASTLSSGASGLEETGRAHLFR